MAGAAGGVPFEWVVNVLLGICGALCLLWLKSMTSRLEAVEKDSSKFREYVAREYVTKTDISGHNETVLERLRDIQTHVTRLEDKIDNKQDKKVMVEDSKQDPVLVHLNGISAQLSRVEEKIDSSVRRATIAGAAAGALSGAAAGALVTPLVQAGVELARAKLGL